MSRYAYGYCGMPCALCTRCRTEGSSRCPGCSCDGYYTVPCKVHRCVREKGLDHCGQCGDFPCPKLGKMGDFRDLDTGRVKERTCRAVAAEGLPAWLAEYEEKADLLTVALERYNNGRMKRYLCELFLQQDLDTLRRIMARDGIDERYARMRISAQKSDEFYRGKCDYELSNTAETPEDFREIARDFFRRLIGELREEKNEASR